MRSGLAIFSHRSRTLSPRILALATTAMLLALHPASAFAPDPKQIEQANREIEQLNRSGKPADAERKARALLQDIGTARDSADPLARATRTALALSLFQQNRFPDAAKELEAILTAIEARFGKDHPETLPAADNLAGALNRAGEPARAEALYRRVQSGYAKQYGADSQAALELQGKVAVALADQGKKDEARASYADTYARMRKALGEDAPGTLKLAQNYGMLLTDMGDHKTAGPVLQDVYDRRKRKQGADHVDTLTALALLGADEILAGQSAKGLEKMDKAAARLSATLGPDAPLTRQIADAAQRYRTSDAPAKPQQADAQPGSSAGPAASADEARLAKLANEIAALRRSGDLSAAQKLADTLLTERRRINGPDAAETFVALNTLADVLRDQSRFAEAAPLLAEARETTIRLFGTDHPATVAMTTNVAVNLDAMGRHKDAEPLFRQAVSGWEKLKGRKTPDILPPLNGLAFNLKSQGRFAEAEALLREQLALRKELNGPDNPATITTKVAIGQLFADQGLNPAAEPWLAEAVSDYIRTQGEQKRDTLSAMGRLAIVLKDQRRFPEAETLQQRIIDVATREYGQASPIRIRTLNDLARTYEAQEQFAKAEPLYREALDLGRKVLGEDNAETLIYAGNLGALLMYQQRFAEAEPVIRSTLEARTRLLGKTHPQRLYSLNDLALCLFFQGRYAEAEPLYRELVPAYEAQFGKNHPFTQQALNSFGIALLSRKGSEDEAFRIAEQTVKALRTQRGIVGKRRGLAAAGRQPTENEAFYFSTLMDAAWQLGEVQPDRRADMFVRAIVAAQEAMDGPAGQAVAESAARAAADSAGGLGDYVRQRRELGDRWAALGSERNLVLGSGAPDTPQKVAAIDAERSAIEAKTANIDTILLGRFPQYFDLVQPRPLDAKQIIDLMQPDEALLLVLPSEFGTHVIAVTDGGVNWNRADLKKREVALLVRRLLWDVGANVEVDTVEDAEWSNEGEGAYPFDRQSAFALYQSLIAPVEAGLKGKRHVFIAAGGALSSLPFGMLVTEKPTGADGDPASLRSTKWFADAHALIQIPSLQSLKFLRDKLGTAPAGGAANRQPFMGFGDPVLEGAVAVRGGGGRGAFVKGKGRDPRRARPQGLAASQVFAQGTTRSGGGVVDIATLKSMARLPGTAQELAAMRAALGASPASVMTGAQATEANVRKARLSDARILALATHGLMAGEIEGAAEPGLVFTPPSTPTEADDGLLTASEVATLKLDADWVILSACNTAAGDGSQGAPGLSGLARAFFYAGARNLLASHWPVRDDVAAKMTVRTIEIARDNPALSRAEAFAQAMREIRNDASQDSDSDTLAHPNAWAPFTLIGDGAR